MLHKKSYLTSRALGGIANSLFSMVFIWWLQISTKSSFVVGISEAIFSMTAAFSIFYGPIIDKSSFKKISIYSMIVQTTFLFILTGSVYYLSQNYKVAIVLAGIISICDEFFNPADRAILKETVTSTGELNSLISRVSVIDQFVNIAGTILSGILLTILISGQVLLICCCLSLASVAILIYSLNNVKNNKAYSQKHAKKYWKQIFNGYKFIKNNKFLRHYFWSSILYSFVTPALTILLPRIAQSLGSAALYSTFYICFVLGFVVGAYVSRKLKVEVKLIGITWTLSSIPLLLMLFFYKNWFIFCFLILLFGLSTSIHNILSETMIQIKTNDSILGRVLTTIRTSTSLGGPIGSLGAGLLLDNSNELVLVIICFILVFFSGINILIARNDKM